MFKRIILLVIIIGTYINATLPTQSNVTKLYIATFNRIPDLDGLNYWIYSSDLELELIAKSFFEQTETIQKYPEGSSNLDFIKNVYKNLFNRNIDKDGGEYWLKELDNNRINRDYFLLAIINGAKNDDSKILNNKTTLALEFIKYNQYDTNDLKNILNNITADRKTVNDVFCKFELDKCVNSTIINNQDTNTTTKIPISTDNNISKSNQNQVSKMTNDDILSKAFKDKTSNIQVRDKGEIIKILADDTSGSKHQKFIVKLASSQTILISHNIDLAPRINSISINTEIEFYGEYEWNNKGGVVHWTHKDPHQKHIDGWLKYNNKIYQ